MGKLASVSVRGATLERSMSSLESTKRARWGVATGVVLGVLYGAAWLGTARLGVKAVEHRLGAERPALVSIEATSPCPFVVTAAFGRDYRGDGELLGKGSARYVWVPGLLRKVSREDPFIFCGF